MEGQGPHLSSGADQGVCGFPCPAWEDYIYMHLHTALPNLQTQPCQNTSCSKWPFALTPLQHQLWVKCIPTSANLIGQALLYLVQC